MRADKLYESVLALLGEEEYSCEDYTHLRFRVINQALSMCLSAHNTNLLSRGEEPIDKFMPVLNDGSEIPIDDNFALEVLAPLTAGLLCADHDRDKANVMFDMANAAKNKYSKVNFKNIVNSY